MNDNIKALGGVELLVCAAALATPALFFFWRRFQIGIHVSDFSDNTSFARVDEVEQYDSKIFV